MKILFAKIPNSDISNRAIYDKDGFSGLDDNSQTCYGQMFHDSNGEVYALPFSNDELDTEACIFDIEKYFGIDVDFIKEVTIAFFVDTSNGTLLDGWYRHAQIYKYCQPISPVMGRYYIFKTKAIHSVWLPMDIRFKTNLVFKDFVVPNESEARKIMNYISTYSGEKLNIILDEALSRIEIPKIDSVENCVKYCNEMYKSEDISLLNFFKMIKICLQTIEKYGNNEAIYGLLADLYADLGQQELTLKYDKLRCELNPTYENRRFYALSLYCSEEWKKAIPIFSELLDEKSDDEIKMLFGGFVLC